MWKARTLQYSDCRRLNRVNQNWKLKTHENSNTVKDNANAKGEIFPALPNSRTDKTSNGPKVKAKDEIIASKWNLVDRSLNSAKISHLSDIVPSIVDTKYSVGSDGYASIVASEQRAELFGRIGTLEWDNMRLRGMLGVERQRVDRLRRKKERAILLGGIQPLVMTINSNLPPQIHEAQVEALKEENVKDENLHGMDTEFETRLDRTLHIRSRIVPMARHGSRHRHLYQQVLDVFKDEGRLSEAIRLTGTSRNTPLEIGKYSHGFHHKPVKNFKLEVSSWKGVIRFGKRGKLNPRYIGPFKVVAKIDNKLSFIEEPIEIMDHEVKRLKQSRIPIFKVRWNLRRGPEFTWGREDQMQKKYPFFFAKSKSTSDVTS
ncbi:hypothetical protein Tco_1112828 [Tanacetum coccineum]|uniref:Reverse transcriptase domain-containing protein n=1 Tax=Tanacetum coccineum TaxID=301880 RepID=A0ABQ5IQF1_9ASTR